jgi:hypothetical protein
MTVGSSRSLVVVGLDRGRRCSSRSSLSTSVSTSASALLVVRVCHIQACRLRRPRSTKVDPPRPPLLFLILLQQQLLLRHLLCILLLDPLQLMRHDRRNAPRIVIIVIPTRTEITPPLPLAPPSRRRRRRSFLHQQPQHAHLALNRIMLRKHTLQHTHLVDVAREGGPRVVQLGLEVT